MHPNSGPATVPAPMGRFCDVARAKRQGDVMMVGPGPDCETPEAAFLGMIAQARAVIGPKSPRDIKEVIFVTPRAAGKECPLHRSLETFARHITARGAVRGLRIHAVQGEM